MSSRLFYLGMLVSMILGRAGADGPVDNNPDEVRPVPPPGIGISESDRTRLAAGLTALGEAIESLREQGKQSPTMQRLIPDVAVYHKAVRVALDYGEFYRTNEIAVAERLLEHGMARAADLASGRAPWLDGPGLVVRGYESEIDGSVQPYGLVVPASYRVGGAHRYRLDFWFHGRGETLTELSFIDGRERVPGEFTPAEAIVLHLYGRYCNGNKFAGEMDLFEAYEHVRRDYPIDEDRLVVRGFSMGGAACWQFAVHYPDWWAAAAPGAGFSETPEFLRVFQNEAVQPSWFEQKLWRWYNCTDYALNLFNCPTVAYSGEKDRQKQAADMMAAALQKEGMELMHVIGPGMGHQYDAGSREAINRQIDSIAAKGRDRVPAKVKFTTWTLRYNRSFWVQLDRLEQHWEQARVDAEILDDHTVEVTTRNVAALTLAMPAGWCPLDASRRPLVMLDGRGIEASPVLSDRSWTAHFQKAGPEWAAVPRPPLDGLVKRHGLQGPIDDAFMGRFIMVTPSRPAMGGLIGNWAAREQARAIDHWRRQFRGEARVKRDTEITEEDIASSHLVVWGDPSSNGVLGRIAGQLPIRWDQQGIHTGEAIYPSNQYALVMVYPNPLNTNRYVVVNSGFTFREYDYLNNARQVPKLPDFAIVDLSVPPTPRQAGKITRAGFFNEDWQLR